jgi:hypothetical protein
MSKRRRKRPGRHTVHTKDSRYKVPNYPRGEGPLATQGSDIRVVTEGGGIGFEFPTAREAPIPFEWGKTTLFDSPMLMTGKYSGVPVGGKSHAILRNLSEEPDGTWLNQDQIKERHFVPYQAHTVANLSKEGVERLVKRPTYLHRSVKTLYNADCVVVRGTARKYKAKITPKGRLALKEMERKYGDTRTGMRLGYATEFEKVKMKAESGESITVGIPKDLPPKSEVKYYEKMFGSVKNEEHWKFPTKPVIVDTRAEADLMARAITYYAGGAEVEAVSGGKFRVTSEGYYHYIGA